MMHTETRSYPLEECFEHIRESLALALALPSRGLTDPILGTDRRLVVAGGLAGPDKTILLLSLGCLVVIVKKSQTYS